jgi:hypothetical protein
MGILYSLDALSRISIYTRPKQAHSQLNLVEEPIFLKKSSFWGSKPGLVSRDLVYLAPK